MKLFAPAKINLYLEVIGKRRDGYHNIETIFQTVSLFDEITIEPDKDGLSLKCSLPALPVDSGNIAMRAAQALRDFAKVTACARIKLKKNIPLGAGLGGGSSDAAAVLKGLIKLWKLKISSSDLLNIAVKLGADVPFFLKGGTAEAGGIGEKLKPLSSVKKAHYLLIYPDINVATSGVYAKLQFPLTNKQKINTIRTLLKSGSGPELWGKHLFNRLEGAVLPYNPAIKQVKDRLSALGYPSLMSGSGSSVFALLPSKDDGVKVKKKLNKFYKQIFLVRTV